MKFSECYVKISVQEGKIRFYDIFQQQSSYTAEIRARPEHHKFLIGRSGANIKKVRDKTGARIIFPADNDEDRELIVIIGKNEAVQQAKSELETLIKTLVSVI